MTTPPSNKRSLDSDNDSPPPAHRVRLTATPPTNLVPTNTQETPGPSRPPTTTPPTPRFIPIRGTFSSPPPPPSNRLNRRLLHPFYLTNMLDDVQRRYDAFPLRGNPDPNFLSIIDDIEKTFKREYGPNVFLSMEHIRFGDEWVKWKLSGRLMSVLMAREEERGLETWSYEEVRAAERVAGYWEGLRGMFAEEEEEAEAEVMGQVEVQEDGTEVEVDDEDEIEEDDSDEEGSMYDETDVEDGPVARE